MPSPCHYLVLDTESSMCPKRRARRLVSLAYEVVAVDADSGLPQPPLPRLAVHDLVRPSAEEEAAGGDRASEAIHGISPKQAAAAPHARPLRAVLRRLVSTLDDYAPISGIVAHGVVADVALLLAEFHRAGWRWPDPAALRTAPLICTKLAATATCRLPLPPHLRYDYPVDLLLHRLHGAPGPRPVFTPSPFKWPSLEEARATLTLDDDHAARHDAGHDAAACREIFLVLLARRITPES